MEQKEFKLFTVICLIEKLNQYSAYLHNSQHRILIDSTICEKTMDSSQCEFFSD